MTAHTAAAIYRGRFAPTPSGLLHDGSLLTALASYLDARAHGGRWLLRIDDLDTPRCVPGAADGILHQLEAHELHWDEAPRYQSAHLAEYRAVLDRLRADGHLYACRCTRAELARTQRQGPDGPIYAGTCRSSQLPYEAHAWRYRCEDIELTLDDRIQGTLRRSLSSEVGDFVVQRRDGIVGYHLACSIDEAAQGITDIVRGADLIGSTFAQLALMRTLHLRAPAYAHVPVLLGTDGLKLSKQNHARPIDAGHAAANLRRGLMRLGYSLPLELELAAAGELLDWAIAHWRIEKIPTASALTATA